MWWWFVLLSVWLRDSLFKESFFELVIWRMWFPWRKWLSLLLKVGVSAAFLKSDLWDPWVPLLSLQLQFPHDWVSLRHHTLKMRPLCFCPWTSGIRTCWIGTKKFGLFKQPAVPHTSLNKIISNFNYRSASDCFFLCYIWSFLFYPTCFSEEFFRFFLMLHKFNKLNSWAIHNFKRLGSDITLKTVLEI